MIHQKEKILILAYLGDRRLRKYFPPNKPYFAFDGKDLVEKPRRFDKHLREKPILVSPQLREHSIGLCTVDSFQARLCLNKEQKAAQGWRAQRTGTLGGSSWVRGSVPYRKRRRSRRKSWKTDCKQDRAKPLFNKVCGGECSK